MIKSLFIQNNTPKQILADEFSDFWTMHDCALTLNIKGHLCQNKNQIKNAIIQYNPEENYMKLNVYQMVKVT